MYRADPLFYIEGCIFKLIRPYYVSLHNEVNAIKQLMLAKNSEKVFHFYFIFLFFYVSKSRIDFLSFSNRRYTFPPYLEIILAFYSLL